MVRRNGRSGFVILRVSKLIYKCIVVSPQQSTLSVFWYTTTSNDDFKLPDTVTLTAISDATHSSFVIREGTAIKTEHKSTNSSEGMIRCQ